MNREIFSAKNIATTAVLLALVVLLQTALSGLRIGSVNLSFVLVPIVIGGMVTGVWCGAFLGLMFGIITIINGLTGADPFTYVLLNEAPVVIVLTCLFKGVLAGLVPAVLFKLLKGRHNFIGTVLAAAAAPVINTSVFFLGMLCIKSLVETHSGVSFVAFMGTIMLFNFLAEFAINIILTPSIYRVYGVVTKKGGIS